MLYRGRNASILPWVVTFIVLGVLSVFAGYFGGRHLLYELLIKPSEGEDAGIDGASEPDPDPVQSANREAPFEAAVPWQGAPLSFYRVQAGAFSVEENAKNLQATLRDEGHPAVISPTADHHYRVVIGFVRTEAAAKEQVASIESEGFECIFVPWELPGFQRDVMTDPSTGEKVQRLTHALEDLMLVQSEMARDVGGETQSVLDDLAAEIFELSDATVDVLPAPYQAFIQDVLTPHLNLLEKAVTPASRESYFELVFALGKVREGLDQ